MTSFKFKFKLIKQPDAAINYRFIACRSNAAHFFLTHGSVHHDSMLIKVPTRCNSMQTFIYCRVTLHVSGVTAPIIRSTKTVSATSGISHGTGTATSFHRGLIGTAHCCIELDLLLTLNHDARNHEFKKLLKVL